MRASTRRRITIALVGLLVLVLIGWFVQGAMAGESRSGALPPRGESPAVQAVEQDLPGQPNLELTPRSNFRLTDADGI